MSAARANDLEEARKALEALLRRGQQPTRFDARRLLIALGELASEDEAAGAAMAERLRVILEPVLPAWEQACREEMELAVAEHVKGTDPRHLGHPRFDFVYAVEARRRLEMRLLALECLGQEVEERLLEGVEAADERLEPHLRRPDSPRA